MLKIPYVPTAYVDETLSSLLTRLVIYNGTGLWRSMLEEAGYGRRTLTHFYAIPHRSDRLCRLLLQLGYTYEEMLRRLTSLPFWMSFNNATSSNLTISLDESIGPATKLDQVGQNYILAGARFCPDCLTQDLDTFGEPYLHRHHQLPVAMVCAFHGTWLRRTCTACGITVMPFNKSLLRPPSIRCICGFDLTKGTSPSGKLRRNLWRLSQFAKDTLSCSHSPWSTQQVRAVLLERMGCNAPHFYRNSLALLEETYGPLTINASGSRHDFQLLGPENDSLSLCLETHRHRAPEYCTLLSASGLTFDEFKTAVQAVQVDPKSKLENVEHPRTIQYARYLLLRFRHEFPTRWKAELHIKNAYHFWLLRLRDSAWLQHSWKSSHLHIPSLMEDRQKILGILEQNTNIGNCFLYMSCFIRARIRDSEWLQQQLPDKEENRKARIAARASQIAEIQKEREFNLSRAIFTVLRTESRPARIHAGLLASVAKLRMHQAQFTISRSQALKALMSAINADKNRRMAAWAARTLIHEGRSPNAQDVLVRAGLVTSTVNRKLANEALELIAQGKL